MTNIEINQRIAEACGWKPCKYCAAGSGSKTWRTPDDTGCRESLPNYTTDLNEMHYAEQGLTPDQWQAYFDLLVELVAGSAENPRHADYPKVVRSTARQRAEAFLRTLGKWEEC
jgi:hypothetical protein